MRAMVDANVLLDVFQDRHPFYVYSAQVATIVIAGHASGIVPAHVLTTVYYIVAKSSGRTAAIGAVDWILEHFGIADANLGIFQHARRLPMKDFEDAVVVAMAVETGCDIIVTRNVADFANSPVSVVTPPEFFARVRDSL